MGGANSGRGAAIFVIGGAFTFRTLHPPDRHQGSLMAAEHSLDALITVTMPAISGAEHIVIPIVRIRL